jgi:hypothetical protein
LRKLALGKLGWKPSDFYQATLAELFDALNGKHEYERSRDEITDYYVRRMCFYSIAPHRGKDSKIKRDRDLWLHPFDKDIEANRLKNIPKAEITFSEDGE